MATPNRKTPTAAATPQTVGPEAKVKKIYTTPGPHLDEVEDNAETRAAMNEEMPSPVPRKDH